MFRFSRSAAPAAAPPAAPAPAAPLPGAPLFDAAWYAARAVDPAADPREDYLARGSAAARSPCPLFSPAWYLATNPDVAAAGDEPLEHWLGFGWREGRDPSGLFSTRAYLDAHPALAEAGRDPLSHYLAEGRAAGARPHPHVAPFDPAAPDIAVVMAYEGDRAALDLALWALECGRGPLALTVYLICDGAEPARSDLDRLATARSGPGFTLRRQCETRGGGLPAALNAGIWAAGQGGRHSHVLLLEQAAILPEGVLAGLLDLWAPAAAPVLNLAETEQAVPVDFDIYASAAPLEAVAGHFARRREMIPGAVAAVDRVEPACLLFQADALAALGLLDDRAARPAAALAPLLAAMDRLGLARPVLARHLYAHRLERSPIFTRRPALPSEPAVAVASEAADRAGLKRWTGAAPALFEGHAARRAAAAEAAQAAEAGAEPEPAARFGGEIPDLPPAEPGARAAHRALQRAVWRRLVAEEEASLAAATGAEPVLRALAARFAEGPPVLVLTMDTDPVTGDEKDGYVQRIVAIDKALAGRERIYLKLVEARHGAPALRELAPGIARLEIAHRCPVGAAILAAVIGAGACIYSQSLVGIDPPILRRLLPERTGAFVMDMHGAVPEEFVLYGDRFMAQKYARYEAWAAREADRVVCVTEAMAAHFEEKLGIERKRMVVCPIYTHSVGDERRARVYNDRPRAVYAGGTQRWQMIPELAALVAETAEAVDWALLTPDVEGLRRALARAGAGEETPGLGLRSASQAQVFDTYLRSDFGLLLREDCTVNRVACPTKLVEYLRFGVVPVLATPNVGDFVAMGMRYVPVEAFRAGDLPSPAERAAIAEANHAVFEAMLAESRQGLAEIAEIAGAAERPAAPLRSTA